MKNSLAFLRITLGLTMLLSHGLPKLLAFSKIVPFFPDPFGLGPQTSLALVVFAQFFCAILLITGTTLRLATLPLIITMLTAFFIIHGQDPFAKKELAFLYLSGFLTLFIGGPGNYALKLSPFLPNLKWLKWSEE